MNELIEQALIDLNKQFGKGTILPLGSAPEDYFTLQVVPTGIKQLDIALGCGGVPRGRTIEVFGPYSSGKSTLATIIGASWQSHCSDAVIGFIEPENTFDMKYAKKLGVDPDRTLVSQPTSGEDAIDVAARLFRSGVDLLIVDSVSALIPMSEANASMSDNFIGAHARLMSRALRVLTPLMNKNKERRSSIIFINQTREKVGQMFGNPNVTTGGNALPFYASIRLSLLSGAKEDVLSRTVVDPFSGEKVKEIYGQKTRITVKKNKVGNPNIECSFDLVWGEGPDKKTESLDVGLYLGVIKNPKQGTYIIDIPSALNGATDEYKIRGIEKLKNALFTDESLLNEVNRQIDEIMLKKLKDPILLADVDIVNIDSLPIEENSGINV